MKKLHSFDEVFDGQKVFRKVLEAMSNPGRILLISEQAEKMYGDNGSFLALAMTLLDNEVSFYVPNNKELAKNISLLTLSTEEKPERADFIFVEKEEMLEEVIQKAKCGTLEDPQKSATIIIKANGPCDKICSLYGAGIDGIQKFQIPDVAERAMEFKKKQNYEYPQGIDMMFITSAGELLCIPRLVMQKEEEAWHM